MTNIIFGDYTTPKKKDIMKDNEVMKPFKEHQYFHFCYVTNKIIDGEDYALTVVTLTDLKRYFESTVPLENEIIYNVIDVISVGLDGNGVPRIAWYEKQLYEEIRTQNYKKGERMSVLDSLFSTGVTFIKKNRTSFTAINTDNDEPIIASQQEANTENMTDAVFCQKKLFFNSGKEIELSDDFVTVIKEISDYTRVSDVTFPYAVINEKIQQFDNIRTAIGVVSSFLPVVKGFKLATKVLSWVFETVGGSPLVLPAKEFYNLRGPIKLSKAKYQRYSSEYGQDGKLYYEIDKEIQTKENDNIKI